jgi:nudix-type nucleoside diphosphatase (YffH/AdpP family)
MADSNADSEKSIDTSRTAVVKKVTRKLAGFMNVDEAVVSHQRYDGKRQTITRLSLERGDSVALLMVDRTKHKVWLTEQFRYPTLAKGPGWILEIPAGTVNPDEDPDDCAKREAGEETGHSPETLERIATFYVSPGGTSERIVLYFAAVDGATRDAGLAARTQDKEEDIKLIEQDLGDFLEDARLGRIDDAKTLIAGLWLLANRARLKI